MVNNGVGPAGSGNVTLAAGTGIAIATADGTSTISATSVVDITTSNLSDLANVNSTAPSTGQVLTYTASNEWAPANVASADHTHNVPTFQEITNGTATTTSDLNLDPATGVVVVQGGTVGSGSLTLNCENNSHGVTIKGPPHSSSATYSLTLPDGIGTSGQVLSSDGTGFLQWITPSSGSGSGSGGVSWSSVPTSTSSTGTPGDIAYDATYFYVMTASGWRRTALAGWGQSIIINTQPSNVTTGDATTATFSVNATAPLGSLNYQWQVSTNSGSSWADITGANGSNYSFTAGLSDDGNQYRVVLSATSATSDEISDVVTLTVAVTNYITTESGDPLDAENGENILHDGIGAGTGSGGGSGGGSGTTSLVDLVPADRVPNGAYTMTGPDSPNDISLGWNFGSQTAGLEFNYSGNMVLAHLGNYSAYLDTTNDEYLNRYLQIYRESSTNNWQPHTNLINALGENKFVSRAATIDDSGNNAAALHVVGTNQNILLRWVTNTGTNFSSINTTSTYLEDVHGGTNANKFFVSFVSGSGPVTAYRLSFNSTGNYLGVSIPYKGTNYSSQQSGNYREGLVRVYYKNHTASALVTQIGNDIVPPVTGDGTGHNTDRWELGKHHLKINADGTKIVFSAAAGSSTTSSKLLRYHYNSANQTWEQKATLQVSGTVSNSGNDGVSQDLNTYVTHAGKVFKYTESSDTWAQTDTLTNPTFSQGFNWNLGNASVSRDGTRVVRAFYNVYNPAGTENTGAVIVYRLEGSTWSQYTNPAYGAVASDNLAFSTFSGDGQKIAAAGRMADNTSGSYVDRGRVYVWDVPSVASDNPVISTQPVSDIAGKPTLSQYEDVTFFVSASNESGNAISYQWQYSTNGYSGWTNAPASWPVSYASGTYSATPTSHTYTARLANLGNIGTTVLPWDGVAWRCILTSGGLTTTSTTAYSYVQYLEVTGTSGGPATFTCNVNVTSNSTATITYQWYEHIGNNWSQMNNETGQNVQVTSAGQYKCLVTNTTNGVQILQYGPTNSVY
ncbi:MAG: hypothetical protein ISR34_09405 [Pirellulales bacterium]|nr:hypothetical protein [Pirellulales bacterium]